MEEIYIIFPDSDFISDSESLFSTETVYQIGNNVDFGSISTDAGSLGI